METHIKALGWFNMIFGVLALVVPIIVLVNAGGFTPLFASFAEEIYAYIAVVSIVFHLIMAIPSFVCGFFIRKLIDPVRTSLILVSALNMLNAPFGSLLGAYGLWVLMRPETDPLFANAPAQHKSKKKKKSSRETAAASSRSSIAAPGDLSGK